MDLKALFRHPKQTPISAVLVVGGLAYFAAAELGLALASLNPHAAPAAPAAGLAVALLMVFGRRAWPAVTLGALVAHGLAGNGFAVAVPIAAGDTLAALAGEFILSRNLRWHGGRLPLGTALGYAAASLLAAVISASVGLETLRLAGLLGTASGVSVWLTWWTGHALGLFLLVPALLSLAEVEWRRPGRRDARRLGALLAGAVAINAIALLDWRAGLVIAILFMGLFVLINYFGVRWFSRINNLLVGWKLVMIVLVIIAVAVSSFHGGNFNLKTADGNGFSPYGTKAIFEAIPATGIAFSFLGWRQVWVVLFFASFAGALVGISMMLAGRRDMSAKLPFGTFLALAAFAASLWGEPLLDWYLQLYQ